MNPDSWDSLKATGEEGNRRDDWTVSRMQWTLTWEKSTRCWGTRRPGGLQSMGSQRVEHDLATEQQAGLRAHVLNLITSTSILSFCEIPNSQ